MRGIWGIITNMPINQTFIVSKIERLKDNLEKIKTKLAAMSDEEIIHSEEDLAVMERYFQLMVDYAIDINHHFIKEGSSSIPDDIQGTFAIMGEADILPAEFANKIASSVGLRNRIVHQYEDVKPKVFIENLRTNIGDYDRYIKYILQKIK